MADNTVNKMNLLLPLFLFVINLIFSAFLIEELIDASEPNYGIMGLLTPITGLISIIFIKKSVGNKRNVLVRVLQVFNWIYILFPIVVFVNGVMIMIG